MIGNIITFSILYLIMNVGMYEMLDLTNGELNWIGKIVFFPLLIYEEIVYVKLHNRGNISNSKERK